MDRSIMEPYRAEERELSRILYEKLKGLMLIHPASEELRKCITDEMFIKPNQHAFFHVMAFLCRLHDPYEFRKRFLWPITDKRSEGDFRKSTMDYLKYLNDKHQLNWLNVKSYLVVMPGGMKFIIFLLDFIKFIINEQIKHEEKYFSTEELHDFRKMRISEANINSIVRKSEFCKTYCSEYLNAIEEVNNVLEKKVNLIMHQLNELSTQTNVNAHILINETFLERFSSSIQYLHKEKFPTKPTSIMNLEKPIQEFKLLLDKYQSKEVLLNRNNNNKELVKKLQERKELQENIPEIREIIQKFETKCHHPDIGNENNCNSDDLDMNDLIRLFNCIHEPLIMELSKANDEPPLSPLLIKQVNDILDKLQQMEEQLKDFQQMIYNNDNGNNKIKKVSDMNTLNVHTPFDSSTPIRRTLQQQQQHRYDKIFLSTPPIVLDSKNVPVREFTRLSLADTESNIYSDIKENNINANTMVNLLTPKRQFPEHTKTHGSTIIDTGSVSEVTTLVNPMLLLQSLRQQEDQKLFSESIQDFETTINDKIKPFNMKHSTTLKSQQKRQHLPSSPTDCSIVNSTLNLMCHDQIQFDDLGSSLSGTKKLLAFQKVQNDNAPSNLNISPSGRLGPLTNFETFKDEQAITSTKTTPIIMLNNVSVNTMDTDTHTDFDCKTVNIPKPMALTFSNSQIANDYESGNEVDLFNISATVLRNVTP